MSYAVAFNAMNRARKQAGHNAFDKVKLWLAQVLALAEEARAVFFDKVKLWLAPQQPACLRARFMALKATA